MKRHIMLIASAFFTIYSWADRPAPGDDNTDPVYYQFKETDKGLSCHGCTLDQMEYYIQKMHSGGVIDIERDMEMSLAPPNMEINYDLYIFDRTRYNFVKYEITYRPYEYYLNYELKTTPMELRPNFVAMRSDYDSYYTWVLRQADQFFEENPTGSYAKRKMDDDERVDNCTETDPSNPSDSLFDAIGNPFESTTLNELSRLIDENEAEWHQDDCLLCRVESATLFGFGASIIPDHDRMMTINFPDGVATYTVAGHMNHTGPRFTLNLSRSYFKDKYDVYSQGRVVSNQTVSLAQFFYHNDAVDSEFPKFDAPMVISPCFQRHLEQAYEALQLQREGEELFTGMRMNSEQCTSWPQDRTSTTTFLMPVGSRPCSNGKPNCVAPQWVEVYMYVTREQMIEVCGH